MKKTLLVIDDDKLFAYSVKDYLQEFGIEVLLAHTGGEGVALCHQQKIDLVLLDQNLPDGQGASFCSEILQANEYTKIIFATAYPSFDNAIDAIKVGAYDYLSKPFDLQELKLTVENAFYVQSLENVKQVNNYKNDKLNEKQTPIVPDDILYMIDVAAKVDASVLITGETGTGKNILARSIHYRSARRQNEFISVNCAAFSEGLINAELFGYQKGAFTGAISSQKGVFELAEGGTLLLDEIGEMPLHLQTKLLGVLDEKKIKRLGSETIRPINVRIIASSNVDMEQAIEQGSFRRDLYFRLSVIRIHLPPLRERIDTLPQLCDIFLTQHSPQISYSIPDEEMEKLKAYHWPGNIRELKNVIERTIILQKGPTLYPSRLLHLTDLPEKNTVSQLPATLLDYLQQSSDELPTLESLERRYIIEVFQKFDRNLTRTAKALGISLSTLKRRIKQYELSSSK